MNVAGNMGVAAGDHGGTAALQPLLDGMGTGQYGAAIADGFQ